MKFTIKLFCSFVFILSLCVVSNAQTNWVGTYIFAEDGGKTVGGSKIYISHTIIIKEADNNLNAQIYSQGFQTSRDIFADTKETEDKIEFYYRKKGTDQSTAKYEKGDFLLSLEKKFVNGKIKLLTNWKKFKPALDKNAKSSRVYFKRVKKTIKKTDTKLDWVRIESPAKDWSFAVPKNYLVYREKGIYTIYYASKDFSVAIKMDRKARAKNRFRKRFSRMPKKFSKEYQFFEMENFIGSQFKDESKNTDSENRSLILASNKGLNSIYISTENPNLPIFLSFLESITLKNKKLFKATNFKINEIETVNVSTLESDKEIVTALQQEDSNQEKPIKTEEELLRQQNKLKSNRTLIMLIKPQPGYSESARKRNVQGQVKFNVEFLANGRLGKIRLVSSLDKNLDRLAFEAVKKIKFLPPKEKGKSISVRKSVVYNFYIY